MSDQQPSARPNWLQPGHAFCPSTSETVKGRMFVDNPGFVTTIYSCEHGEWTSLAEAWYDHEQSDPSLDPNPTQAVTLVAEVHFINGPLPSLPPQPPPTQIDS